MEAKNLAGSNRAEVGGKRQSHSSGKGKQGKKEAESQKKKPKKPKSHRKTKAKKPLSKSSKSGGKLRSLFRKTTSSAFKSGQAVSKGGSTAGKGIPKTGTRALGPAGATAASTAKPPNAPSKQPQKPKQNLKKKNVATSKNSITKSGGTGTGKGTSAVQDLMSVYQDDGAGGGGGGGNDEKSKKGKKKRKPTKKSRAKSKDHRRPSTRSLAEPPRRDTVEIPPVQRGEKLKILFRDPLTELETIIVINDDTDDPVRKKSFAQQIDGDLQQKAGDCRCLPNDEFIMRLKRADDAACLCGNRDGRAYSVDFDPHSSQVPDGYDRPASSPYHRNAHQSEATATSIRRPIRRPGPPLEDGSESFTQRKSSKTKKKGKSRPKHKPQRSQVQRVTFEPPPLGRYSNKETFNTRFEKNTNGTYPFVPSNVYANGKDLQDLIKQFPSSEQDSNHHSNLYPSSVHRIETESLETTESSQQQTGSTETSASSTSDSASSCDEDETTECSNSSVRVRFVNKRRNIHKYDANDSEPGVVLSEDNFDQYSLIRRREQNESRSKSMYENIYSNEHNLKTLDEHPNCMRSLNTLPNKSVKISELMKGLESKRIDNNFTTADTIKNSNIENQDGETPANSLTSINPLPSDMIYYYSSDSFFGEPQPDNNINNNNTNYEVEKPLEKPKPFWKRFFNSFSINRNVSTKSVRVQTLKHKHTQKKK